MHNVVFLLKGKPEADVIASCEEACVRLEKQGIRASVRIGEPARLPVPEKDGPMPETHGLLKTDTLILADDPALIPVLSDAGYAVIALQHAGNASESFSGAKYIFAEPEEVDLDSYRKAWQRLSGLPWDILETKRLKLRETTVEDVDSLYGIYAMPGMTTYMEGLFPDPEDEKRYMRDYIENVYGLMGVGVWSIIEKESGALIGRAGFSIRNGFESIELGFFIGTTWQGKGYAQEACDAVLRYGRRYLEIDTVQALVKEGNTVSEHILEKLGFSLVKTVDVEEDIYGKHYPEADSSGVHRPPVSPARYGRYHLYLLNQIHDRTGGDDAD
ncbi:MAG: GNAT family N-acetyltransferase [Lachnospiraceae bacterium]|nr:GNAT family N-acetyltransferase [Lachnospiraceae bacterium]